MVSLLGTHGAGDCLLALQCAHFIPHPDYSIFLSVRQEVFDIVNFAFKELYILNKVDERYGENNAVLTNPTLREELSRGYSEFYYIIPDLLFRNPYAFDYQKYRVHPQTIRSTRLLTDRWNPEKVVYVGLISTTEGYLYDNIGDLVEELSKLLPNHLIYVPWITKWAGKDIKIPPFKSSLQSYSNIVIDYDPPFQQAFSWLSKSEYFIGTDNGPSHFAYHYGIPRLILDPQYNKLPWVARWREDINESISINSNYKEIAKIVQTNIGLPQTTLVPRRSVLVNPDADWHSSLLFKY